MKKQDSNRFGDGEFGNEKSSLMEDDQRRYVCDLRRTGMDVTCMMVFHWITNKSFLSRKQIGLNR